MNYSYVIIDDDQESVLKTKAIADGFSELFFIGSAQNASDGLSLVLEKKPEIIFLEIDPVNLSSNLSLGFIDALHKYLTILPKIIVTTQEKKLAFDSFQYEVKEYLLKPVTQTDIVKMMLRLNKLKREEEIIINREEINKNYFKIAKDLYEANLILASYDKTNGKFIKWFESLGLKKTFVYNSIKRYSLFAIYQDEEKINKLFAEIFDVEDEVECLSNIHISEPTRPLYISYDVYCLK